MSQKPPPDTVLRAMERTLGSSSPVHTASPLDESDRDDKQSLENGGRSVERTLQSTSHSATTSPLAELDMEGKLSAGPLSRSKFVGAKLGDIMIELGMITPDQREKIQIRQAETKTTFGECAIGMRLVSNKQLQQALSTQFNYQVPTNGTCELSKDAVIAHEPFGPYGEAMRSVVSRLISNWLSPSRKTLAVVSASRREGRSHVSANLALAFAQFGKRTLLIDGDMRRPSLHNIFKVPIHPGLSRALCGLVSGDIVREVPFLENLSLITAGPTPPNATEVLSRAELPAFLRHAEHSFDVVIIDTSSSHHVDAEIICRAAGSALLVSSLNRTHVKPLSALKNRLAADNVTIAGILINEA